MDDFHSNSHSHSHDVEHNHIGHTGHVSHNHNIRHIRHLEMQHRRNEVYSDYYRKLHAHQHFPAYYPHPGPLPVISDPYQESRGQFIRRVTCFLTILLLLGLIVPGIYHWANYCNGKDSTYSLYNEDLCKVGKILIFSSIGVFILSTISCIVSTFFDNNN